MSEERTLLDRIPAPLRPAAEVVTRTVDEFLEDGGPRLAAALAYFLLVAAAPLLIVAVAIAGTLFERQEIRDGILGLAYNAFGNEGAVVANQILMGIQQAGETSGVLATVLGVGVALFGASAAFGQLQAALNIAWGIRPRPESFTHMLRRRGFAFLMVIVIGVFLIAALAFGTGFVRLLALALPAFPGTSWFVEKLVSFAAVTVLFVAVFSILPDRRIDWRETIVGALVTSLLFNIGSVALGEYLGRSSIGSLYGAAGSFAVVLVWLFYSTQVFIFGAEFTYVWAERRGVVPPKRSSQLNNGEA